jgi:CysZ protein
MMFKAAGKVLIQMFSQPFRRVLLKSIGLALILIVVIGIALHRALAALAALAAHGAALATGVDTGGHWGWNILIGFLSFSAGLGIFAGAVFLMPAVTAFVGSFFVDEIAEIVERTHYANDPPGRALPLLRALIEGLTTALLTIAVYLCAAPFLLVAGFGFILMFLANAYLLGREYFLLAAMRFRTPAEAKAMRRANPTTVYMAGLPIAVLVSIPVLNFVAPLFAMAFMVHMHKRMSARSAIMVERRG